MMLRIGLSRSSKKTFESNHSFLFDQGFSLIEIILVMLLIGVVFSMSAPALNDHYHKALLRSKTDELVHMMRYVQSRAVVDRRDYQIKLTSDEVKIIVEDKESSDQEEIDLERWGRSIKLAPVALNNEPASISFYHDGRIDPVEFSLFYRDQSLLITTKLQRGYVRVLQE